jgi:hypothetical protein
MYCNRPFAQMLVCGLKADQAERERAASGKDSAVYGHSHIARRRTGADRSYLCFT